MTLRCGVQACTKQDGRFPQGSTARSCALPDGYGSSAAHFTAFSPWQRLDGSHDLASVSLTLREHSCDYDQALMRQAGFTSVRLKARVSYVSRAVSYRTRISEHRASPPPPPPPPPYVVAVVTHFRGREIKSISSTNVRRCSDLFVPRVPRSSVCTYIGI